ncbi:MAG: response regulator transcription factor [Thermoanaerobaculia bacterium]|nr:response regulator transcription factor [Thermoanaerobaculia bacterium]
MNEEARKNGHGSGRRSTPKILLVEDERHLAQGIAENLEDEGHHVTVESHGARALDTLLDETWDLAILDVMLPGLDGFEICRRARTQGSNVPILFLSARGEVDDRIRGLEAGGDDYLPKPFHLRELLLRVDRILDRTARETQAGASTGEEVRFGDNVFSFRTYEGLSWDERSHTLTHKEAMILRCLVRRRGEVVKREDILEEVWGHEVFPSTRTIDNFILRLRKRFEPDPERPVFFHTVRGVGYRFTQAPSADAPSGDPRALSSSNESGSPR